MRRLYTGYPCEIWTAYGLNNEKCKVVIVYRSQLKFPDVLGSCIAYTFLSSYRIVLLCKAV